MYTGKSVGIITTDALVGASPSSAYAHAAHRNWRTDGEIRADDPEGNCKDIARQLVEDNLNIEVNYVIVININPVILLYYIILFHIYGYSF